MSSLRQRKTGTAWLVFTQVIPLSLAPAEQMRRMDQAGVSYDIVPGVSSFVAAAAAINKELTLPELSQTVIISRAEGRTPVPDNERLEELAKIGCTLALFLSITLIRKLTRQLIPYYGELSCRGYS